MTEKIHTETCLSIYTGYRDGGNQDIAHIQLQGMTLIDNKDLARLRHYAAVMEAEPVPSHIVDVLQLALRALAGPAGRRPKTQKALDAWEAIRDLLATAPIERETK